MSQRILVVDDAVDIRFVLSMVYENLGYTVLCCEGGKEAIDLLEEGWHPDLILLDLMMPGMNGWEFLEKIETIKDNKDVSIVVMSAFHDKGNITSRLVRELVTKPVKMQDLKDIAKRYAGGQDAQSSHFL